jgi:hemolysin III
VIQAMQVQERRQSFGEEIANTISHGIALLAAVAVTPILIISAIDNGSSANIVGVSIFAGTMILLYLTSTLYHVLPGNRAKQIFQIFDHAAIYLLIAGTYTPFTFGVLRGAWGWTLFGLVWGLAISGVVLKAVGGVRYQTLSVCLYLVMGWLVVIAAKPLWLAMPLWGLFWLITGGIAYTIGVVFFVAERIPYSHFIWHLFVVAGTTCHVIAVLYYAS